MLFFFVDLPYEQSKLNNDFTYASDLVAFIKRHFSKDFLIGIAGYPEKHPKAKSTEQDIMNLKAKVNYTKH